MYALPPDEFVPARDALARQLSEAHDPRAAAVRKLRRPVGLAWVLDHLAQRERERVEGLVAGGDRLRAAQRAALEGLGAGGLREAEAQVRDAARALRLAARMVVESAGRPAAAATMAHLEVLLRRLATASDELRERFRRGVLDREPAVEGAGLEGLEGLEGLSAPGSPGDDGRRAAVAAAPVAGDGDAPRAAEREARGRARQEASERRRAERARRQEVAAARAQARERARLATEARRALARAERQLAAKRAGFETAQTRLDAARAELERAEGEARRWREQVARPGVQGAGGRGQQSASAVPSQPP